MTQHSHVHGRSRVAALLRTDWRNVARDPLLLLVLIVPVLLAGLVRVAFPWTVAVASPHVDLEPYGPFLVGYMLILTPMLVGGAVGFMLLDEREEQVLAAIAVTPLGKRGWLTYRLTAPVAATALVAIPALYLSGLEPSSPGRMLVVVVLAALEAPLATLLLAALAANKVQAMALAKAGTLLVIAPFATLFVEPPWQYVAGLLPHYWIVKLTLAPTAEVLQFSVLAIVAAIVHVAALLGLTSVYDRRAE
jgi:fluoroquinolone transport system permease protein